MRVQTTGGKLKTLETKKCHCLFKLRHAKTRKEKDEIHLELGTLNNSIKRLKANPVVTEHAMLRYLERVKGIDIAAIEREILNPKAVEIINTHGIGPSKIPLSTVLGCRLVVEDKTVITVEVA
ncbi:hypothetical protein ACN08N_23755 [Photobacterium leiognathi subsp. mandapamensis]|uniref:hypothetical protein n=1 Tax=Photobacterium leiognathi TaxID=553611 RepID=UPI003AF3EC83